MESVPPLLPPLPVFLWEEGREGESPDEPGESYVRVGGAGGRGKGGLRV